MIPRRLALLAILVAVCGGLWPTSSSADLVYFVSKTTGGLYNFSTTGTTITAVTGAGVFPSAAALAVGPDGNLYVGDSTAGGSIRRYSTTSGSVSTVVTLSGSNPAFGSGPVSPASIAFTGDGRMLVGRNPQEAYLGYPGGQVLEVVGWGGGSPTVQNYTSGGSPNYQTGLTVAADGTLYASDTTYDFASFPPVLSGNVLRFNGSGAYQSVVTGSGAGAVPPSAGLSGPTGIAVSGNSLYVASVMNGFVYRTDLSNPNTATNTIEFASSGGDYLGPLALTADGSVLAGSVSGASGLIYQFNSLGNLTGAFGALDYGQIGGIVVVPEPTAITIAVVGLGVVGLARLRRRRV